MKLKKYIYSTILTGTLLGFSSCNNFLDINVDPNNAADASVDLLLPSAEGAIGFALGNDLQIKGSIWAQYWTQNPNASQYRSLEQYSPAASDFNTTWGNLNTDALEDLQKIIEKGTATNKKQYVAIATLLKAYTIQLSTDLFGDIPMTEALKGDAETPIFSPKFDKQQDIYNNLVTLVDEALALIDLDDPNHPTSDDLIYGGDMEKWEHFGNTLKLKLALRLSEVDPTRAAAIIQTLADATFIQPGETAQLTYIETGGNQNPLYSAIAGTVLNGTQNLVASSTAIDFFATYEDPRIEAFYQPASNGNFTGIAQGAYATVTPGTPVSIPSTNVGADAQDDASALAPVNILTDYESDFLQAEAITRKWLTGDAKALYNQGIEDSFNAYEITDSNLLSDYIAQEGVAFPGSGTETQLEAILTQKWAAMCGNQGIEAWIEWRRTGYPSFFTVSEASIIGEDRVPGIFLYPTDETQRNSNAPTQHKIYDKVWWDTK